MPQSEESAVLMIPDEQVRWSEWGVALATGLVLAAWVWRDIVTGGGLWGGDPYTYFLPQKVAVAQSFADGVVPLWHPWTGHGYPLLAESQAAIFYPTTQVLYRVMDVHAAFHTNLLLHYVAGFVFAWRFARCQGASAAASLLAATVFIYGWFPARVSLEWAAVGAVWLPLCLWLTDRLIRKPSLRRLAVLSAAFGVHLLAGHFNLAFITQLTCCSFALLRFMLRADQTRDWKPVWLVPAAVGLGVALAAVQILPTWELRQQSQRQDETGIHDPAYGHMPPVYSSQLVASWWYWHTPEMKQLRNYRNTWGAISADTVSVEAHLYWGLAPFGLVTLALVSRIRKQAATKLWAILGLAALFYATGWLVAIASDLPGFGYFKGPGRYTVVAAMSGAVLASLMLTRMLKRASRSAQGLVTLLLVSMTVWDLEKSNRAICDSMVVETPPFGQIEKSWVRRMLIREPEARVLSPMANVTNVLKVSSIPTYLGLGPEEYFTPLFEQPTGPDAEGQIFPNEEKVAELRQLGVTHVLTQAPLTNPSPDLERVSCFPDPFLGRVWFVPTETTLYRITRAPGRVSTEPTTVDAPIIKRPNSNVVEITVTMPAAGILTLRDLDWPGWMVEVDGHPADTLSNNLGMRQVRLPAGPHTVRWFFAPWSFAVGSGVSLTVLALLVFGVITDREFRPPEPAASPPRLNRPAAGV